MYHYPFTHAHVAIRSDHVLTIFRDGASVELDVEAGDNEWYRGVALKFGYSDWRRYARHHDLTRNWLAELRGTYSAALRRAAEGIEDWPSSEAEENEVNRLQRAFARLEELGEHREFLAATLGEGWRFLFDQYCQLLSEVK